MNSKGMRSKFEKRLAASLKKRGVKYGYEVYSYEYDQPLRKNRSRCDDCGGTNLVQSAWYTPDFFLDNGVIVEAKGRFTAADRRKMNSVRESHPELDLRLVFMRDNKIHKRSETTYSDWAEANDWQYAIGDIPEDWTNED